MPDPESHRIAKLLARAGVASRREVERMIADGRVAKDGIALDTPATILRSLAGVTVDGQPVEAAAPARLFLYHKPPGLLVTERDPAGRPTIYDRLPQTLPRVVPVGRLDLATEGLLLLTTDGGLKRQLELPATGVERAYRARAYGPVTQPQLELLIEGVEIEGVRYGSINANLERRTGTNVWIEMILTEGKNREVRRVLEYLGLRVSRLIRTRYGPFVLGDLPPGEVGEVRRHDVESFGKHPTRLDLPQPARGGVKAVERPEVPRKLPTVHSAPARAGSASAAHRPRPTSQDTDAAARRREARAGRPDPARISDRPMDSTKPDTPRPDRQPDTGGARARAPMPRSPVPRGERAVSPHANAAAPPAKTRVKHFRAAPTSTPDAAHAKSSGPKSPIANPARAARAQAHRSATGRPDTASPRQSAPSSGPKFGRGAPKRPAPQRPPRTRK